MSPRLDQRSPAQMMSTQAAPASRLFSTSFRHVQPLQNSDNKPGLSRRTCRRSCEVEALLMSRRRTVKNKNAIPTSTGAAAYKLFPCGVPRQLMHGLSWKCQAEKHWRKKFLKQKVCLSYRWKFPWCGHASARCTGCWWNRACVSSQMCPGLSGRWTTCPNSSRSWYVLCRHLRSQGEWWMARSSSTKNTFLTWIVELNRAELV